MATRDLISLKAEVESDIAKGLYSWSAGQNILRNAGLVETSPGYDAISEGIGLEGLTDPGYLISVNQPHAYSQENIARGHGDVGTSVDTNTFLAALNSLQTGRDPSVPVGTAVLPKHFDSSTVNAPVEVSTPTPTPTPIVKTPKEGDTTVDEFKNTYTFTKGVWQLDEKKKQDTKPSLADQLITRLNNGETVSLATLDVIESDTDRTAAAKTLAENIARNLGPGQSATDVLNQLFLKYFDSPTADGFSPWAETVGYTVPQRELIEDFERDSNVAFEGFDPNAGTGNNTITGPDFLPISDMSQIPDYLTGVFQTPAEYNDWRQRGRPGNDEYLLMYNQAGGTPDGTPGDTGAGVPGTMDIFGNMQTQEAFQDDVFRRFLAEQVSPSGDPRTLSPFMMRGAQSMRPQLMAEYNQSIFDPNTWSPEGPTTTFADWLRAGERPTRQGLFDRLGDIGSIVAGGDQALNAPGLSMNEALRRSAIQSQFGTETGDSRDLLKGMFTTAALSGVAPAFRYPIQAAAENLFQSQRALQPETSFLSFLNERL